MTTQNGNTQVAQQAPAATADPISQALATLIQQSTQTNQVLQQLTGEIKTMNQQLFGGPVRNYQPQQQGSAPQGPVAEIVPERPAQPQQAKEIIKSRCSEVGITKVTTATGKWKLNFHMDGEGWSAMALGRRKGEFQSLLRLTRQVLDLSQEHFSEETFSQRNKEWQEKGNAGNYEEIIFAHEPFTVEWYKKQGGNGKTYAYVERVYPCTEA